MQLLFFIYYFRNVQYGCILINVFFGSKRISWKFDIEGFFEFLYMIFYVFVYCCGLYQFGSIYFFQKFYVNRLVIFIYFMIFLRIVFLYFIDFIEFKIFV